MADKPKYIILDECKGCDVHAAPPDYHRKDGGKFVLDENLSIKDLDYLYNVVKYKGIIRIGKPSKPAEDKPKEETKKKST